MLLAGDKPTLRRFYKNHHPRLLSYIASRVKTREDAEEIAQDAFLSFLDSLPLFSFRASLWTFLVSIARHEIADYFRRLYAKKAIKYVPFVDQIYTKPLYSADQTAQAFNAAIIKLTPKHQTIILWKYEDGLSIKQIAGRLGISLKAAESRLFRARQAFKLTYNDQNID